MSYTLVCEECSKLKRESLRQCSRHPCTCGTVARPVACKAHPEQKQKHEAESAENEKFFALLAAAKFVIGGLTGIERMGIGYRELVDAVEAYNGN